MTRKELEEYLGSPENKKEIFDQWIEQIDESQLKELNISKEELKNSIKTDFYLIPEAEALTTTPTEIPEPEVEEKRKHTKIAIHAANQFHKGNKVLSLFSPERVEDFSSSTGIILSGVKPDRYGVILNTAQRRVFEGILKVFSDSNYSGDRVINKAQYVQNYKKLPNAYDNIDKIPVVKITQAELITLSGYDLKSQRQGDKVDVTEALNYLATKQFCFYWMRLKHDEKGKPVKDRKGNYAKEEVLEVGTLFRVKIVKAEGAGKIDYYEIAPTAVLLDQLDNYFLLFPSDWREEAKKLIGDRGSKYIYNFLFWLRLQYEYIRRNNFKKGAKKKEYCISMSWEDVAIELEMPPAIYKANRKRAHKIIEEAYSTAIKLGYLLKVETAGAVDKLYLNDGFYPQPGELI